MPSLSELEPNNERTLIALTQGWSLNDVRTALRTGNRSAIDRDVTLLFNSSIGALERFASSLLRKGASAGIVVGKDSEDIAVEAFDKVCHLLRGENGDRVQSEIHLLKVLFRAVRCVWVDGTRLPDSRFSRSGIEERASRNEPRATTRDLPESIFGERKTTWIALRMLFVHGEEWGRLLRKSNVGVRHYRQYQALALYELGERLCNDLCGVYPSHHPAVLRFWQQLAQTEMCIPEHDWFRIETAAQRSAQEPIDPNSHLYESLRSTVEEISGADLRNRAKRQILRHEMGRFLAVCRNEIERLGSE